MESRWYDQLSIFQVEQGKVYQTMSMDIISYVSHSLLYLSMEHDFSMSATQLLQGKLVTHCHDLGLSFQLVSRALHITEQSYMKH